MYHWRRPSCLQGGQGQSPQTRPGAAIPMTTRILGHPERVLFSSTPSLIPQQSSPIRLLSAGQLRRPMAPLRSSRRVGPAFALDPLGGMPLPPPALPPSGGWECGQQMLSAGQLRRPRPRTKSRAPSLWHGHFVACDCILDIKLGLRTQVSSLVTPS